MQPLPPPERLCEYARLGAARRSAGLGYCDAGLESLITFTVHYMSEFLRANNHAKEGSRMPVAIVLARRPRG